MYCFLGEKGVDGKSGREGTDGMNGKDGTNGVPGPAGKNPYSLLFFKIKWLIH